MTVPIFTLLLCIGIHATTAQNITWYHLEKFKKMDEDQLNTTDGVHGTSNMDVNNCYLECAKVEIE